MPVPLVDDVHRVAGGMCTVFQRMNETGDMLRVATNVVRNGKRAIGTFIPAVQSGWRGQPRFGQRASGRGLHWPGLRR